MRGSKVLPAVLLPFLGLGLGACSDSSTEPALDDVQIIRQATQKYQDLQAAQADGFAPLSPCVASPAGSGMTLVGVEFMVPRDAWYGAGGQSLSTTATTTDGDGEAQTTLTLGDEPGTYTVEATPDDELTGSPVTFEATANDDGWGDASRGLPDGRPLSFHIRPNSPLGRREPGLGPLSFAFTIAYDIPVLGPCARWMLVRWDRDPGS